MEWMIEPQENGMLIRSYLQEVQHFSRRILKAIKYDGGEILVNGTPEDVRFVLTAGDRLEVQFPKEVIGDSLKPEKIPLHIVFEDEMLLVVDKPSGMAVAPSFNHLSGTLANALLYYYIQKEIQSTIHIVTRLDRDTSGLCLIAKNRYCHSLLSRQQKAGRIDRTYLAIAEGQIPLKQGTINLPIARKNGSVIERTVADNGKRAVTHFTVTAQSDKYSLVTVQLETGRTHQIRVHFSHIGHPLLGDDLYSGSTAIMNRQALNCSAISFEHPFTNKRMSFQSAMPDDFKDVLWLQGIPY